jgi:hypothetical protein
MRRRGMRSAIPLADAAALAPLARRTALITAALAAAALIAVVAALIVARRPQEAGRGFVPTSGETVVVLDVSASLSADTFSREGAALERLSRSTGRLGLIVFSDTAYVALPLGTPARELMPVARQFAISGAPQSGAAPSLPVNPWSATFTSGTKISEGLDLAQEMLARAHARRGHVFLVSDLADDPQDILNVSAALLSLYRMGTSIAAVGLDPSPADTAYFGRLLGRLGQPSISTAPTAEQAAREAPPTTAARRTTMIGLALAALSILAGLEWYLPRLGPAAERPA